ncbi:MAG: response regulator [Acidobacteria bacterium]|nr:response regulator [Acidobacteriota bacterium]
MGTRVLLADDSITIQKLVEMAFSDTDFELLSVSDGKQAIEKLNDFRPDIVLADAIMPVKDGYQVCEHIKSDPQFANVPVVLLTGRFQPYDEGRAQAVGIDERIVKPFVQDQLVSLVRQLVPEGPQDTLDLEPIEEAEETLESELTDEEASYTPPNINADSHTTIRVKPDDLKAFLKEVEQPADEVEELDQLDEVEELDLADEDDLEEVFEDSFSKSLESLDLDDEPSLGGETQAINQTEIQSRLQQEADSIDATVAMDETEAMDFLDEAEAAEVQEEVLPPAEFDESPVMSVEDDEDLEKTVKISEFESFQAISEQHHLMEERHHHEEPQDSDVMDLDPNQMRTLSLDDEEQEPQAESTFSEDHTFEHDSFEIKEPESLDLRPPEHS